MGRDEESSKGSEKLREPLLRSDGSGNSKRKESKGSSTSIINKGSNSFAIACTALVAFGPISLGYALGYSSPIQDDIIKSLDLDLAQFSFFGSLVTLGAMAGAVTSGNIADHVGRKGALVAASAPHIIGWLLIAFCQGAYSLYLGRFLVGLGVGIISFIVPMYVAEIAPKQLRGALCSVSHLAVSTGIVLAYLGGLFLDWRMLAGVGVIPCSILMVGLIFIPESPRWLAKIDGHDEVLKASLQSLRGRDFDITGEMYEIKNAVEESKLQPEAKFSDLSERRLFRPLLIGVGLPLLQQFSGMSAIMFYSSAVFQSAGLKDPKIASFGLGFLQVIMCVVAAGLMDKAGRRILLMVSAGGMAVSSFLVGFSFYFKDTVQHSSNMDTFVSFLSLISLLVYVITFSLGMGSIPWILMSEVFPVHIKGRAGSLATLANWSGSWIVTLSFNFLLQWSSAGSFWVFSGECALTLIFVAIFVPETRGKTLEEIEGFFK